LNHWPFWVSGLALASIMLVHWFTTGRMMAVSGRFTALTNRFRYGESDEPSQEMAEDDLVRAIRAMTAETFGEAEAPSASASPALSSAPVTFSQPQAPWLHIVFFGGLLLGGLVSALAWGTFAPAWGLSGVGFSQTFGDGPAPAVVLLVGGMLTGFGTRMAGGCTSGHGLCGVSRLQPGSLLATAAFFGAGIAFSFALEAL
jgi:uncharacterized membrane protein YedE/YeeE